MKMKQKRWIILFPSIGKRRETRLQKKVESECQSTRVNFNIRIQKHRPRDSESILNIERPYVCTDTTTCPGAIFKVAHFMGLKNIIINSKASTATRKVDENHAPFSPIPCALHCQLTNTCIPPFPFSSQLFLTPTNHSPHSHTHIAFLFSNFKFSI
ncbi:hypothetical protein RJT34_13359 [Clitoria ternatea]|uniref:Uncharacterized protein n=1 Tax=Clitoria ternatea TaxID=43366 RepID=A0AAN9JRY8_CLITE